MLIKINVHATLALVLNKHRLYVIYEKKINKKKENKNPYLFYENNH